MTLNWDMGGNDLIVNSVSVGATAPGKAGTTLSGSELTVLDSVTPGTAAASKAVVLDSSKGISTITSATITTLTSTTGNITSVVSPTNLTLNATTTGTIGIGNVSTGAVTITPATTVTGAITPTGGVAASGGFSVSPKCMHTGNTSAQVSTDFTDQTPVITEVYFAEVYVPANTTITGVSTFRGSVSSGNFKMGLANSAGVVVATSASQASSGTDSYVDVPFTAPYAAVGPATYYVLAFYDNTTVRANTHTIGRFVAGKQTGQTYATGFTTITPGSSFTTALGPVATLY